jgi:hypothetical protein
LGVGDRGERLELVMKRMQWTRRGAHLLLQTRTRALDGTLRPVFERWYPGLANDNPTGADQAAAA